VILLTVQLVCFPQTHPTDNSQQPIPIQQTMTYRILITGGAGYIGSHMVARLIADGHQVHIFDNLSRGHRDAVPEHLLIEGDIRDFEAISAAIAATKPDLVMHFAALAYVGESVRQPWLYYENNVVGSLRLIEAMRINGVNKLVFSSTCATYGEPSKLPIDEAHPQHPINPYGRTKLIVEQALADHHHAQAFNSVSLRYFNAAGCSLDGQLGERHAPETHLIPLTLEAAMRVIRNEPQAKPIQVFGGDFETPDGTCIRDYIHVEDLCDAHLAAADSLMNGQSNGAQAFNLGNGQGYSVMEVIRACESITGVTIPFEVIERREGDPAILVGSAALARKTLGWQPRHPSIEAIVESAWRWRTSQNDAFSWHPA